MGDSGVIKTGGASTPKPTASENAGPIIEESQESAEYQQDLQVVLGTAFGVIALVGLIAFGFLFYRIYKTRQRTSLYAENDENDVLDRDVTVDVEGKWQPVVLLLYAKDCPVHEQVVASLAMFLMEACGVTVSLDLLEESEILERGIDDWLVDRLQEADYIMVLCSLGARLRATKKHVKMKPELNQAVPDYFAVAVDYVSEKMRAEKQKGLTTEKFITAYMEYSTRSDIPPQLETASQFSLMKDIHKLHLHLKTHGPDKSDSSSESSTCESYYHETEAGAVLKAVIEQAKIFFREHPTWLEDSVEITHSLGQTRKRKGKKHRQGKGTSPAEEPMLALLGQLPADDFHQLVPALPGSGTSPQPPDGLNRLRLSQSLPPTHLTQDLTRFVDPRFDTPGIFQGRQNSLPLSLASSCQVIPQNPKVLSKSLNNVTADLSLEPDHDGLPCFFCNSTHMNGLQECPQPNQLKPLQAHTGPDIFITLNPSQISLQPLNIDPGPSQSQTVLQAEVHHEWGQPSGSGQKSATISGDAHFWKTGQDASVKPVAYQSLPPHCCPPPGSTQLPIVGLRKWSNDSCHLFDGRNQWTNHRSLSNASTSTDESGSLSELDMLERDLYSIQNIPSFHDLITASTFTTDACPRRCSVSSNIDMTSLSVLFPNTRPLV